MEGGYNREVLLHGTLVSCELNSRHSVDGGGGGG